MIILLFLLKPIWIYILLKKAPVWLQKPNKNLIIKIWNNLEIKQKDIFSIVIKDNENKTRIIIDLLLDKCSHNGMLVNFPNSYIEKINPKWYQLISFVVTLIILNNIGYIDNIADILLKYKENKNKIRIFNWYD